MLSPQLDIDRVRIVRIISISIIDISLKNRQKYSIGNQTGLKNFFKYVDTFFGVKGQSLAVGVGPLRVSLRVTVSASASLCVTLCKYLKTYLREQY